MNRTKRQIRAKRVISDSKTQEANARLIAVSPDLLDFAETVALGNTEYDDLQRWARELITRARLGEIGVNS